MQSLLYADNINGLYLCKNKMEVFEDVYKGEW